MYDGQMRLEWKRWVALLLLAFCATTALASTCAMTCVGQQAAPSQSSPCHGEGSEVATACPVSQLCGFAFAPVIMPAELTDDRVHAAYLPSLTSPFLAGVDPAPPLNPPPASVSSLR